jgi:hypothetical protein
MLTEMRTVVDIHEKCGKKAGESHGDGDDMSGRTRPSSKTRMIVARELGARHGFTMRVGFANMHHDGAAKRRRSWAWRDAMREQVRRELAFVARSM